MNEPDNYGEEFWRFFRFIDESHLGPRGIGAPFAGEKIRHIANDNEFDAECNLCTYEEYNGEYNAN